MKRIIYYHQMIQLTDYDPETGEMINVGEPKRVNLQVVSDNDKDFEEQLTTVKGYCDDWRIEEILDKEEAIAKTKKWLDNILLNGVEYKGEVYNATKEKQDLLSNQLGLYSINIQLGIPDELTWNTKGGVCQSWEFADLLELANTIKKFSQPLIKKQQTAEVAINQAITAVEIDEILKEFE